MKSNQTLTGNDHTLLRQLLQQLLEACSASAVLEDSDNGAAGAALPDRDSVIAGLQHMISAAANREFDELRQWIRQDDLKLFRDVARA